MQVKTFIKRADYYLYYDHLTKLKNVPSPKNKYEQNRIRIRQTQEAYFTKKKITPKNVTLPKIPWGT